LQYFTQRNVAFCNIDQPVLGRSLAPTEHVTAPLAYVRLHGRNYDQWFDSDSRNDRYSYLYSEAELENWKKKIINVAGKAEVTYVVANNHFQGKAPANALQLKSMITGQKVRVPEPLVKRYPELGKVAEPRTPGKESQGEPTLFDSQKFGS